MWGSIVSTALKVGSTAYGLYASNKQADAVEDRARRQSEEIEDKSEFNSALSLYDAKVADDFADNIRLATRLRLDQHQRKTEKLLSTQRARFGKSGVAVDEGTPIDVAVETAQASARDAQVIKWEGNTAASAKDSLAKRYRMLASEGLRDASQQAYLLEEAAADQASTIKTQSYVGLADNLYSIGQDWGIF